MTNIIPFDPADNSAKLPAEYAELLPADMKEFTEEFSAGVTISFPTLSIKGKTFTVKHGEEKHVITRPDDPDSPASYIDVVVIAAGKGIAKAYYAKQYSEDGDNTAPDCWSNDGVTPDPSVEKPMAKSCKTCPYNQFGSRITDSGKKAKACSDAKRVAVAFPNDLLNPMLLRIPATSLKAWQQYVNLLARKGVTPMVVLTRIKFVADAAYPQLEFKPVGLLPPEKAKEVVAARKLEVVDYITGKISMPTPDTVASAAEEEEDDTPLAEVPVETVTAAPETAPTPAEPEEKPAPKKKAAAKAKPAKEEAPTVDDPEVDNILDELDDL